MFTRIFQIFLFFGHKSVSDFWVSFETIFFFYYPFFFKILGLPFHMGVLGNGLIGLVEGPALLSTKIKNLDWHVAEN